MITKICTDIDQSKKLIELGIDVNTADIWYQHIGYSITDGKEKPTYFPMVIRDNISDDDIPAWSLSALLAIIPYPTLGKHADETWSCASWVEKVNPYFVEGCDTPIDACVAMIERLHEQKIL